MAQILFLLVSLTYFLQLVHKHVNQIPVQKIATVLSFWEAIFALERIILSTYVQEIKSAVNQTFSFNFLHLFDIIFVQINSIRAK